jgi:hypothetical protein
MNKQLKQLYAQFREEYHSTTSHRGGGQYRDFRPAAQLALAEARRMVRAEDEGLRFLWVWDDGYTEDGDCVHNASLLNRCQHEHDGRHIVKGSREGCGCGDGNGHRHGQLYGECNFAPNWEPMGCMVWLPCSEHADGGRYDDEREMRQCPDCEELGALWGIQESDDRRERDSYRRSVEADLASEALHELDKRQAAEDVRTEVARVRYLANGL